MAVSLSVIAAKDSAGTAIAGGLQAQDKSGTGAGPFTLGQILIDGVAGVNMAAVTAANAVKTDGSAVTQPVSIAAAQTLATVTNLAQMGGAAISMGAGVRGAGVQRVTISTDDVVPASQSGTWTVQPGNTANTTAWKVQLFDGTTALPILAGNSGVPAAAAPAMAVSVRDTNVNVQNGAPVTIVAQTPTATANGLTASRVKAAASTNATSLKASGGQLYEIDVFNNAAYNVYLKLYNKASAPTVGTDTPVITIPVQAGGGYARSFQMGRAFALGIAYAITKLEADSDTTVVVADDLTGSIGWV